MSFIELQTAKFIQSAELFMTASTVNKRCPNVMTERPLLELRQKTCPEACTAEARQGKVASQPTCM